MKHFIAFVLTAAMLITLPAFCMARMTDDVELVTDAYSAQYHYDGEWQEYHIPQVNLDGAGVTALNAIIWRDLYDGCMAQVEYAAENTAYRDDWPDVWNMTYQWAINGDVLSIWVCLAGHTDDDHYYVYNMSLSTGERISDAELLQEAGVSREEFNDMLRAVLSDRFEENRPLIDEEYMRTMGKDALSDRIVGMAMPYMDQSGSLCAVAWVYTPAGAGRYLETLTLPWQHK